MSVAFVQHFSLVDKLARCVHNGIMVATGNQFPPNQGDVKMAETTKVTGEDGNVYEFSEKAKVKKQSYITDDGVIVTKFVFRNGAVRTHKTQPGDALLKRLAMHGADQKFGDEFAGVDDVEDCVLAFDSMSGRLARGEWSERKAGEGVAGTSLLARALSEHTGKSLDEVKAKLKDADPKVKAAAARQPKVAEIIARLKAERDAKKGVTAVDAEAAVSEIFG
jgi:hypothetical protein